MLRKLMNKRTFLTNMVPPLAKHDSLNSENVPILESIGIFV